MSGADKVAISELHLHFEGSLAISTAIELAAERGLPWGTLTPAELRRRFNYDSFQQFLLAVKDMAEVLCSLGGLERHARELSHFLARTGVVYAEVYFSPQIYVWWGLEGPAVIQAVDAGFTSAEEQGGAYCAILLDSVRQWGPSAASRVLDLHEATRLSRVVGFGLGGEESVPFEEFRQVYDRARSLGLHTTVHTGEAGDPDDVARAIDMLGVERIAHGFLALESPSALGLLRESGIALDLAITSNYRTRVVRGRHPIRALLDAGIPVTLGTDDPSLFRVDLPREYRRARRLCGVNEGELNEIALNGIRYAFADAEKKVRLTQELTRRAGG